MAVFIFNDSQIFEGGYAGPPLQQSHPVFHPEPNPASHPKSRLTLQNIKHIQTSPSKISPTQLQAFFNALEQALAIPLSQLTINQPINLVFHCLVLQGKIIQVTLLSGQIDSETLGAIFSIFKNLPAINLFKIPENLQINIPVQIQD